MYKRGVSRATYSSIMQLFKRCPDCGRDLPISDFGRNRLLKDGLQVYCRDCCARRGAATYRRKRARLGKTVRERVAVPPGHKRCPGCGEIKAHSEWHRNRRSRDGFADRCKECRKQRQRVEHLKRKFGLTVEEHQRLLAEQGGRCAICGAQNPTHTDHDHETGTVRGLLCGTCNMGLGQFRDNPNLLEAAAAYLFERMEPLDDLPAARMRALFGSSSAA